MNSSPPVVRAVLFDAYGTLFDVYSVGLLAEQLFPGKGEALGVLWRDKQIEYTRLVTISNGGAHYQPFWDLTRAGLRYACKRLGLDLAPGQEEQLMNQYRHLSAFPENREVLQALKARGVVTGILSNGDPSMLGVAVRSAGLEGLLDHVISVDSIRKYKTAPEAYALGPKATGFEAKQIAFERLEHPAVYLPLLHQLKYQYEIKFNSILGLLSMMGPTSLLPRQ